jgi:hypothetical protein
VLKQLGTFLQWIATPISSDSQQRKLVGFGTLLVAYWSTVNLQNEYEFGVQGFLGPTGQPLQPGDPRAFFITEGKVDNKRVVAVVRGDHCSVCDSHINARDIVDFVHDAIKMIQEKRLPVENPGRIDYTVVALTFTRSDPTGVDNIINALKGDPYIQGSSVPVMVISRSGSTIYYTCVNQACTNLPVKIKSVLACVLAGRKCTSLDQVKQKP